MFTPQQIDQISFSKAKFGGYDMQQVDELLEPLTEDFVTLYKENALLKSKMRVLVGKLEEYRKNEASMKESVVSAKRAADKMMLEAEEKARTMMDKANAAMAAANAAKAAAAAAAAAQPVQPVVVQQPRPDAEALIAAEQARVEEARKAANAKIAEIQEQMRSCINALERMKASVAAAPAPAPAPKAAYDSNAVADEIAQNLEALVGTAEETAPKAPPYHPSTSTTSRFANLNLQFGSNYDPKNRK